MPLIKHLFVTQTWMIRTTSILENVIVKFDLYSADNKVAKVSAIGMGMRSQAGVAKKMFKALGEKNINILAISTSEIKNSVLIREDLTQKAVKKLHSVLGLN